MNRFEPPPLPGAAGSPHEPTNPWSQPSQGHGAATPQPYGAAPQAPWGTPTSTNHPRGTTVLVLGILSIVVAPVFGPVAWAMGRTALREADAAPVPPANRSTLQAGMVLGIIGTVFLVMGLLALLMLMGFVTIAGVSST